MTSRPLTDPDDPDGGAAAVDRGAPDGGVPDRSPWHWLLFVPLVVVLVPQIYNRLRPTMFGIPFFYWYQLAVIAIGVTCTALVYSRTRR